MWLLLFLFVASSAVGAQELPRTMDVVAGKVIEWTDAFVDSSEPSDTLLLRVQSHPDAEWIKAMIADRLHARGSIVRFNTQAIDLPSSRNVDVTILDVSTRYEVMSESDSIVRVVTVELQAVKQGQILHAQKTYVPRTIHRTTRQLATASESKQHLGTQGSIPPPPYSMWEDILQPAVFVAAAVVTVVLLFTVRSK